MDPITNAVMLVSYAIAFCVATAVAAHKTINDAVTSIVTSTLVFLGLTTFIIFIAEVIKKLAGL